MQENPKKTDENPDYGRGLFVCEKPGIEFVGAGSAGMAIGVVGAQIFAAMFLVPVVGFFAFRNLFGVPPWMAWVAAGVLTAGIIWVGIWVLFKVNKGNRKGGGYFKSETDSRYRVRAVIPQRKQDSRIARWVQLAVEGGVGDDEPVNEEELKMVQGGFEPIVVRPWMGVKRDKRYWWTAIAMGFVVAGVTLVGLSFVFGGWSEVLHSAGFLGYALTGLAMVGGALLAEMIWPVYVRLVPGQLDFFRYGFLGSGEPTVQSFDLHTVGVCVDFGGYLVSIEPARPVGEPLPALVRSKRWPNGQAFPDGYTPTYFAVSLLPIRHEFAQRLIQAARTDESTPPVSMDRLGE